MKTRRTMMKKTYPKKFKTFIIPQKQNGTAFPFRPTADRSQKSTSKIERPWKTLETWVRKSSWNISFPRECPVQVMMKNTPSLPDFLQTPRPIPYRWGFWENTLYGTSIPIIKRMTISPFPIAEQTAWRWSILSTRKRATMQTFRHRSCLF